MASNRDQCAQSPASVGLLLSHAELFPDKGLCNEATRKRLSTNHIDGLRSHCAVASLPSLEESQECSLGTLSEGCIVNSTLLSPRDVSEHLLQRAVWGASRSSGPGGQHRDKASTRAELIIDGDALAGLPSQHAERLAERLGLDARPLRILSQSERSLARNRLNAAARLAALVAAALASDPPPRRPTRPGRGARNQRLAAKAHRGSVKRLRRPPDSE